jgi:hypothetical protein
MEKRLITDWWLDIKFSKFTRAIKHTISKNHTLNFKFWLFHEVSNEHYNTILLWPSAEVPGDHIVTKANNWYSMV